MYRNTSRWTVAAVLLIPAALFAAGNPESCQASPETQREIKRLDFPDLKGAQRREEQKKLIVQLLSAHPDDLFLQMQYQRIFAPHTEEERTALIARYRALSQSHPGDAKYEFLYANSLIGKDTPQAIELAHKISAGESGFPRAHLLLAQIYEWGKFADHAQAQKEIDAFFASCPGTEDARALGMASRFGSKDLQTKLIAELRSRLPGETDPDRLDRWQTLWNLEFKARPVTEHEPVRKQIAADLTKLQASPHKPDARWLAFLKNGYHLAGDEAASKAQEAKLLEQFPDSQEAQMIANEKWYKDHPWPGSDEAKQKEYWGLVLARADAALKKNPQDERGLIDRFQAESNLDNTPADQMTAAAEAMLSTVKKNQDIFYSPPLEFQVARAYLKRKVHVDRVPDLVQQGWASIALMHGLPSDNESADWRKSMAEGEAYMTRESASILVEAAQQLGKPEIAKDAVAKVEAQETTKPEDKSSQLQIEAQWAEVQGRKLDALLLYRAALDTRPAQDKPKKDDKLAGNVDRLWKELGGTEASRTFLTAKAAPVAAAAEGRWEKPDKEMKAWQLSDLNGQTWKLSSLEGKTVLVNVWASWCGPCKAEHPHLQKLYEQLKNDPHFQIVTFNIDDEIGNVAPYIKENKYTFPVLLAKDYADELSVNSIPRNWIVDAKGKWLWQQIGFGAEDKWEDEMLQKLKAIQ